MAGDFLVFLYTFGSVIFISLLSVIVAIPLLFKKVSNSALIVMLSMSVGVLLSTVLLNLLPEIIEVGYDLDDAMNIIYGFVVLLLLEKFVHWHHTNRCEKTEVGHHHAYNIAPINIIGDGFHNFIDGMVIAGSYLVSPIVGITSTISIAFHEIPQEIADFGVLLYSGLSRKKALLMNFLSALAAVIGAVFGLLLAETEGFINFMVGFAAGNFLYIAASNLVPQLHRHCKIRETVLHIIALFLGVAIIVMVTQLAPEHG